MRWRAPAAWLPALLVACGGGGDSGGVGASTYDVRSGFANFYSKSHSWTTNGSDNTNPPAQWSLVQTMSPIADTAFPVTGEVLGSVVSTAALTRNGQPNSSSSGRAYFRHADATLVGADSGSATGSCNIAVAASAAPSSASIGMSGAYATVKILGGCSASSPSSASYTLDWSLENDAGVALLCMNEVITATSGTSTQAYCFEIAPDGTLGTRARVKIADSQITVNMRNF